MQADFLDAHRRHWEDAEALANCQRWANADHLYGVSTECGLKKLMLVFGMPYDLARDRPSRREDREHADGIWARFESYRSGYVQGPSFILPPFNPFHDWEVSQRYAHQSHFDKVRTDSHRAGAKVALELIKKAFLEGIL